MFLLIRASFRYLYVNETFNLFKIDRIAKNLKAVQHRTHEALVLSAIQVEKLFFSATESFMY